MKGPAAGHSLRTSILSPGRIDTLLRPSGISSFRCEIGFRFPPVVESLVEPGCSARHSLCVSDLCITSHQAASFEFTVAIHASAGPILCLARETYSTISNPTQPGRKLIDFSAAI